MIQPTAGEVNFPAFFPTLQANRVRVDPLARKLITRWLDNGTFKSPSTLKFRIERLRGKPGSHNNWYKTFACIPGPSTRMCALLQHLGKMLGKKRDPLRIRGKQEEVNLVIGHVNGMVIYVEHEKEPGKEEEVHIHAERWDTWQDDNMLIANILSKY